MIQIHEGSTNVYADLGVPDADGMLLKAQLVTEISGLIKAKGWTQQQSADTLGFTAETLLQMQRGHFRDISESRLRDCLARLGRTMPMLASAEHERIPTRCVATVSAA